MTKYTNKNSTMEWLNIIYLFINLPIGDVNGRCIDDLLSYLSIAVADAREELCIDGGVLIG